MPVAGALSVKVYPDTKVFGRSLSSYLERVEKTLKVELPAQIDGKNIISEARAIAHEAERASRVVLDVGVEGATEKLRADLAAQVRLAERLAPKLTVKTEVDRSGLRTITTALSGLAASVGRISIFGAVSVGAAVGVGKLAAALAPTAGALVALPGLAVGAAAGLGVLKLALSGMGKALQEGLKGDTEKFNEALKGMAPAAQATARAIVGLKPQIDKLRSSVQGAFFAGFAGEVKTLAGVYLPVLQQRLPPISAALSGFADSLAGAAERGPLLNGIKAVLDNVSAGLARANDAVTPLANALGNLLVAGAPALKGLGDAAANAATRLATFVDTEAQGGQLGNDLSGALDIFRQLGAVLGNVGTILSSVVAAAGGGGGLLGTLGTLTGAVATFVQSAQGMDLLSTIFGTLSTVAGSVRGALGDILPALGTGLAAAAPAAAQFVQALASGLSTIAPNLVPLGAALGQILTAVTPLLPAVASLVNSGFGLLLPVVTSLVGVLTPVIAIVAESPRLFLALAAAIVIWSNVTKIASAVTKAFTAVQAALDVVLSANPIGIVIIAIVALVGVIIYAWKHSETFRNVVLGAWSAIKTAFSATVAFLSGVFSAIGTFFANLGTSIANFFTKTIPAAFNTVVGFFASIGSAIGNFFTVTIPGWFNAAVAFVTALPGRIFTALSALPGILFNAWKAGVDQMLFLVGFAIGRTIAFFTALPGQVWGLLTSLWTGAVSIVSSGVSAVVSFVAALPGRVWALLTSLWSGAVSIVSAGVSAVVGFFQALPGRVSALVHTLWSTASALFVSGVNAVVGFVTPLPGRIAALFSDLWARAKALVSSGIAAVVGFFRELPGQAAGALSGLGSRIVSAVSGAIGQMKDVGHNIIMGMIDGIKGAVGAAVDAVKHAVGQVVSGAKAGLGIHSPSTVFRDQVGRWIPAGMAEGIDRYAHLATKAVDQLGQATAGSIGLNLDGAVGAAGASYVTNIYPQRVDFTVDDLQAVQARQESLSRAGRLG